MIKKWSMSYPAVNGTEQRREELPAAHTQRPESRVEQPQTSAYGQLRAAACREQDHLAPAKRPRGKSIAANRAVPRKKQQQVVARVAAPLPPPGVVPRIGKTGMDSIPAGKAVFSRRLKSGV